MRVSELVVRHWRRVGGPNFKVLGDEERADGLHECKEIDPALMQLYDGTEQLADENGPAEGEMGVTDELPVGNVGSPGQAGKLGKGKAGEFVLVQQAFHGAVGALRILEVVGRRDAEGEQVFVGDSVVQADALFGRRRARVEASYPGKLVAGLEAGEAEMGGAAGRVGAAFGPIGAGRAVAHDGGAAAIGWGMVLSPATVEAAERGLLSRTDGGENGLVLAASAGFCTGGAAEVVGGQLPAVAAVSGAKGRRGAIDGFVAAGVAGFAVGGAAVGVGGGVGVKPAGVEGAQLGIGHGVVGIGPESPEAAMGTVLFEGNTAAVRRGRLVGEAGVDGAEGRVGVAEGPFSARVAGVGAGSTMTGGHDSRNYSTFVLYLRARTGNSRFGSDR